MKLRYIILLVGFVGLAHAASQVTYQNQRGSLLQLDWHKTSQNAGTLTGTFNTAVGDCKRDMHVPVPIAGFYNGNTLSISINFPHCKQVLAMVGHLDVSKKMINTLWLDAHDTPDPVHRDWNTNLIGTDRYKKVKS